MYSKHFALKIWASAEKCAISAQCYPIGAEILCGCSIASYYNLSLLSVRPSSGYQFVWFRVRLGTPLALS